MINHSVKFLFLFLYLSNFTFADQGHTFRSEKVQSTLIELYTSEGCSSCPPADRWMSTLKQHPKLWKDLIPVAFHVDYWDYIGWKDRFAKNEYSQRQRQHAQQGHVRTVYTPGFLQNAKEWRAWFSSPEFKQKEKKNVGVLSVSIKGEDVVAQFNPTTPQPHGLILNIAGLGIDLQSQVRAGENKGKTLNHDFVVLDLKQFSSEKQNSTFEWQFKNKELETHQVGAIAAWVNIPGDSTPIQSIGGWIINE